MAIKELQTRIALKYDSYENWTKEQPEDSTVGKNLVLLKGELGICEIPAANSDSNVAPTVLFKVGNGTDPFHKLPWASAKAADVYSWAKKSEEEFKTWLSETAAFATDAEVEEIRSALDARIEALEGEFKGDNSVAKKFEAVGARLDAIEDEETGAVATANAYTDTAIGTKAEGTVGTEDYKAATGVRKEIADAEAAAIAAAKSYTETYVDDTVTPEDERLAGLIATEVDDRKTADTVITNIIGTGFEATETGTVAAKVTAAAALGQQGIDDAAAVATDLEELETVTVAGHAVAIEALQGEVADLAGADTELDGRLQTIENEIEAFFKDAARDGEGVQNALDTLVEIQNYLNGEGGAAGSLLDRIAAAEGDIDDLEAEFGDDGRVTTAEAAIESNAGNIESLQTLTSGFAGTDGEAKGAIKTAIEAVSERAEKGITDAKEADNKAVAAQNAVNAVAAYVGTAEGGLVQDIKETAEDAQTRVEAVEGRIGTAEGAIDNIQKIVSSGDNTNAKLRAAITALEELTGDEAKGNDALHTELTRVAGLVDNQTTGLGATYAIATDAQNRVEAIEGDYLKAADVYIFRCGTATTVTHTEAAN